MQYHIQTTPIWEVYKSDGCPLCALFAARQKRLVGDYLAENVMDPDFRMRSNSVGFCPEHIKMMQDGINKLGLALQLETRAAYLKDNIPRPTDKKSAKKTAEYIKNHTGCVICSALDDIMPRYYMTIAQMFANEPEFPELFSSADHCLKHAQKLFEAAEYAGKQIQGYLDALYNSLRSALSRAESDLREFADCFDHKNAGTRPDAGAIKKAIELLI